MSEDILFNLQTIHHRINAACKKIGRDPSEVTLLPVTKTKPGSDVRKAFAAGLSRFAENKVQEAKNKAEELRTQN